MMRHGGSVMVVIVMVACGGGGTVAQQGNGDRVKHGADVYRAQKCQACHSIAGVGNKRYPLDGVGTKLTEEDIRKWIVRAPRNESQGE